MDDRPRCPWCVKARRKEHPPKKRGKYTLANGTERRRYQCTHPSCGKTFGEPNSAPPAERSKGKDIDARVFDLCCSGVTIRRMARLLKVSINKVRRRMAVLAKRAREAHAAAASDARHLTSHVQFDEMETYLRNKLFPLTIALSVRRASGHILSAKVATISAKGPTAAKARDAGWVHMGMGHVARRAALQETAKFLRPSAVPTFICDGKGSYPGEIRRHIGRPVEVETHPRDENEPRDHLFRLNHTCAKIRADVACMARRTWTTTKKIECLQDRLDIYIAWNNGYVI
jgi:transposase-like protein